MLRNRQKRPCGNYTLARIFLTVLCVVSLTGCVKQGTVVNSICPKPFLMSAEVQGILEGAFDAPETTGERKGAIAQFMRQYYRQQCLLAACRGEDLTGCGG